jgi:hypothetical protein
MMKDTLIVVDVDVVDFVQQADLAFGCWTVVDDDIDREWVNVGVGGRMDHSLVHTDETDRRRTRRRTTRTTSANSRG